MQKQTLNLNDFYEDSSIENNQDTGFTMRQKLKNESNKKTTVHNHLSCSDDCKQNIKIKSFIVTLKNKEQYRIYIYPNKKAHKLCDKSNMICKTPRDVLQKQCSLPELSLKTIYRNDIIINKKQLPKNKNTMTQPGAPFKTKFNVNIFQNYQVSSHPFSNIPCKIYRCQFNTQEESCCCSCNSDAMFEVMKSLYDCYKKKNCDNCNCILCGHLPREERRLGDLRKSGIEITPEVLEAREKQKKKMKKLKEAGLLTPLEGKTPERKEEIVRELAKAGALLPEGKTKSEKDLIKKVRTELGLPKEPKTSTGKEKLRKATEAGLITPLEGKTTAQKEKILKQQLDLGVPLPEGRTHSEKALIEKVKTNARLPSKKKRIPSEKLRKAKDEGLLTPLEGKTKKQKEKILIGLAKKGLPLPEGKTDSDKQIIEKVRAEVGLPPEPKTVSVKEKYTKAEAAGFVTPLEGKSPSQKERILQGQADMGLVLPEGRTKSEKALIAKIKSARPVSELKLPSEKLRKAKAAGLLTPLEGKKSEEKQKILKRLALQGIPLPKAKTASEKKLMDKVRADVGLPPEPKSGSAKAKYDKAIAAGIITPLEGKTAPQKEIILKKQLEMGLPLPEGRTPSEKSIIAKVKATAPPPSKLKLPSEKYRKAKAAGLLTPLEGKKPEQKEKILKGLAMQGIPLPEATTTSEKKLIDKVRAEVGLPPEPKSSSAKVKYNNAIAAGIITPLEGKSAPQKEKLLKQQAEMGLPLPEGRTPSEKDLIARVKASVRPTSELKVPSEKIRKAKAAGLFTPLEGKKAEQKEKILKGLAMQGIPLPVAKTTSEKKLMDKIRADVGLPPEPKSPSAKVKYDKAIADGIITPLEGKSASQKEKILRQQAELGLPLPEGRTSSEKDLIDKVKAAARSMSELKVPSEKMRKAKAAGLLTPLEGKKPEQKEKILKGLAMQGIPLPAAKSASEKKLMDKVRAEVGLPPEPKSDSAKVKYNKAVAAGIITPLEGKSAPQKEKILRQQAELGLPLPEGRTSSEKALIDKVKAVARPISELKVPSEKIRKAKAAGLLTPLEGKKPEQKEKILKGLAMQGIPLPAAKSASEKKLIDKVRADVGLPPEPKGNSAKAKYDKAIAAGIITPLEGKSASQKEKILRQQAELGLPLPEGRTSSEKALIDKVKAAARPISELKVPSEKIRKAKAAGLLTPLEGKKPEQKEKILKGLAMQGIPLPAAKSASEKKLIDKVRADVGLPPEPKGNSAKAKYDKAIAAGIITPLEGKSASQKEKNLRQQAELGLPLPEGRTSSEKALIDKVKAVARPISELKVPSEKIRKAKAAGLLTPLEGKKPEQKEKILKGLAMQGIPLPAAKSASEKKLMDKVRAEVGLPPEPKSDSAKAKYNKAVAAGIITPLEGKSTPQKEKILRQQAEMDLPLPKGRTSSEKALIDKVKESVRPISELKVPSEKIRKAKAAGLLTPLEGKKREQKEKILKGLAMQGIPLPAAKSDSEKKIMDKVRADVGLPPEPKSLSAKAKYDKAIAAGIITPLEGKSTPQKEIILKQQAEMGLPLPEGRTSSEKALIAKVKAATRPMSEVRVPSEKIRKAKAAGLLTPLEGKKTEQKEKILKGLAIHGVPLPVAKTASEKKILDKVRAEVGLPPEPTTASAKARYNKAIAAGIITPLEGKTAPLKEKILRQQAEMGLPLPVGRTPSEKDLIAKVKATTRPRSEVRLPSEKIRKAQAAGLLTPIEGKKPEQKEKILKGLAMHGIPLPAANTASENKLMDRVRADVGLPPEPKSSYAKVKYNNAIAAGIITPLEGKLQSQKEKILKKQAQMGLPLPEGRTPSEKALIAKVKETTRPRSEVKLPSEKIRKAKLAGLLTPLEGKKPEQKEKILKGLVMQGIPLPAASSASEKKLIDKVRTEVGLPPEPKSSSAKVKYNKAIAAGIITPLQGKSPSQKKLILQREAEMGLPLPEGRTASEKSLIAKIKTTTRPISEIAGTSEKMRKAQAAGLLTPLTGKSPEQKEKILKGLAMHGIPLPETKTASEKKIVEKVRAELGLPPEPKTTADKERQKQAQIAGILVPLEGKTKSQKEKILKAQADMGLKLPKGRSASEKALIKKIQSTTAKEKEYRKSPEKIKKLEERSARVIKESQGPSDECICNILTPEKDKVKVSKPSFRPTPSERIKTAKDAGFITPLEGKTSSQKENILKGLVKHGLPMPEGKTPSEIKLINKVRAEVGLPPEPKTAAMKEKYAKAHAAGIITPLVGKSPEQKKKILTGLAQAGIPLPEPQSASEKKIINKIREDIGLPPEPKTSSLREKMREAHAAGIITPLEGKSPAQKEKILKRMHDAGVPLPEGRTESERSMVKRVKLGLIEGKISSEKLKAAKAAGLLTPLEGKSPTEKEKIIRQLAKEGLPLPIPKTASDQAIVDKIRNELKLPPHKAPPSERVRKAKAAGLLTPLEGKRTEQKAKILKGLAKSGMPLPEPKTPSEKDLVQQIRREVGLPPEPKTSSQRSKMEKAQAAGIITPLEGKTGSQKKNILQKMHEAGIPLPEGRTTSEKSMIQRIKAEVKAISKTMIPSEKLRAAKAAGLLTPLEGKSSSQKKKILKGLAKSGLPLPEGKTPSEKDLIKNVRTEIGLPPEPKSSSEKLKMRKAQEGGLITPLEGKTGPQKEMILKRLLDAGLPLPEARTKSEKALIKKVQKESKAEPLPPRKIEKLDKKTLKGIKEGKGPSDECICRILTPESERDMSIRKIPISEKLRKAKAKGLLTPLAGKSPEEKEKILKSLAMAGIPLPEPKTASEKKLNQKLRAEIGLPPEPTTASLKEKYDKALEGGIIIPLEGKSPQEKENILRRQAEMGLHLPDGRTTSEKALIAKVKATTLPQPVLKIPSEKLRKAKAAGLLTPLQGKSQKHKENILKGLTMQGIPLPPAKTASEKQLMNKVRADVGLPPEPKSPSMKQKYDKAIADGIITPLEGKSPAEKEKILHRQAEIGLPLPEGRTTSEKAIIAKVKAITRPISEIRLPSEKIRKAKAAGLLTPLEGKKPEDKEKILKGLAMHGIPMPMAKTPSEKKLMEKIRAEIGLPPEPESDSAKHKYDKAIATGIITPLEGKTSPQKEKILKKQAEMGLPLPKGRTPSEKAIIAKVKATAPPPSKLKLPSEKYRKAKAAGLLTPLEGKKPEQKEKILKGLAMQGIPLPEATTTSEKKLIDKVRAEVGLPPEPKSSSAKVKYNNAIAAGIITPLEGKSAPQKEKLLKQQAEMGLPLPEGRTPSEKDLIARVKASVRPTSELKVPSEKIRKAKAAGLVTPLEGKKAEQKEKILKGLAMQGIPLPVAKTTSEKKLMDKIRADVGLPPEPKSPSAKVKYDKAIADGIITPLEGKSASQKEKILRQQAELGLPLPEGRTSSEKDLIDKVKAAARPMSELKVPSEKMRKAKAAGLLTPLEGKKPEQKEKILKGLAMQGIPLPAAKSASEKKLMDKVRAEVGLPPEPKSDSAKVKYNKAVAAGIITPLEGKSAPQKEKILRQQAELGLPLPEGRTSSEKALIAKVKATTLPPSEVSIPSEKIRKAKAAGLLTPLKGKTPEKKEKILKTMVEAGLPLPEGTTKSEKSLIKKIKTEYGIPPKAKTPSEKEILKKAKAEGILTPLKGKSQAQKEKILKGLAEAGLPMPEGTTASEKELVKKVRKASGLPPEPTPSEKLGKIKTKTKKVGISTARKSTKAGIVEEFEDIIKTTTCDRGCGCDKKKIRFKHSYVKIRVTSPDISSLCPCPEECLPGVKGGVFTDNEGIKVTVGRITGILPFSCKRSCNSINFQTEHNLSKNTIHEILKRGYSIETIYNSSNVKSNKPFGCNSRNHRETSTADLFKISSMQEREEFPNNPTFSDNNSFKENTAIFISTSIQTLTSVASKTSSDLESLYDSNFSSECSLESLYLIRTDSSLSFSSQSIDISTSDSISFISVNSLDDFNSSTNNYTYDLYMENIDKCYVSKKLQNRICNYYNTEITQVNKKSLDQPREFYSATSICCSSEYYCLFECSSDDSARSASFSKFSIPSVMEFNRDMCIYQVSQSKIFENKSYEYIKNSSQESIRSGEPIVIINNSTSDTRIDEIIKELILSRSITYSSSVILILPNIEEDITNYSSEVYSSIICIRSAETFSSFKSTRINFESQGIKIYTKGKRYHRDEQAKLSRFKNDENKNILQTKTEKKSNLIENNVTMLRTFSTDTTQDRPCCCSTKQHKAFSNSVQSGTNIFSEFITPMIVKEAVAQGFSQYFDGGGNIVCKPSFVYSRSESQHQLTSVRVCKVPPCSGRIGSHRSPKKRYQTDNVDLKCDKYTPNNSCDCSLRKENDNLIKAGISSSPPNLKYLSCDSCGRSYNFSVKDEKYQDIKARNLCPCERHSPAFMINDTKKETTSVGCQCCVCADAETETESKHCICKDKKVGVSERGKKKIVTCECPQEEIVNGEVDIDHFEWIDEKYLRKIRSDLTQTMSGFKINKPRRQVVEEEMSFEEALKYFEKHIPLHDNKIDEDSCSCKSIQVKQKIKNNECECPYELPQLPETDNREIEPFVGIKFHMDGKGSSSKGLSGICCFDLLHDSNVNYE